MERRERLDDLEASLLYIREDLDLKDYVYDLVLDRDDAEDVIHDACNEILGWRREEFDPASGMDGLWVFLRELCLHHSKTYKPYGRWDDSPVFGDQSRINYLDYFDDNYEERYQQAVEILRARAGDLTLRQRECFEAMMRGESQAETGKRLKLSTQTVNEHFTAARKKLNPKNPDLHTPGDRWRSGTDKWSRKRQIDPEAYRTMDLLLTNILANQTID